jgi:hypothetical protein
MLAYSKARFSLKIQRAMVLDHNYLILAMIIDPLHT